MSTLAQDESASRQTLCVFDLDPHFRNISPGCHSQHYEMRIWGSTCVQGQKTNWPPTEPLCFVQPSHRSPSAPTNSSVADREQVWDRRNRRDRQTAGSQYKNICMGFIIQADFDTPLNKLLPKAMCAPISPVGFWTRHTSRCVQWTSGDSGCLWSSSAGSPPGSRDPRKSALQTVIWIF